MRSASCVIFLCVLFGLIATEADAQDMNDEMKKRLRQSLIAPEKQSGQQQYQQSPQILPGEEKEVLKVSPFTKLPTKGDRIQLLNPPEKYEIHINTTITNAAPIDERLPGSVRYEFVGKNMQMISTAGTRPSASFDRGPIKKKHKKNANILKPLQK